MAVNSLLDTLDYDLPHSKPFLRKLPALADVFDPEKMTDLLQETLFDPAATPYAIIDCRPGKAMLLADHTCNLQFDLKLLNTTTNQNLRALINARLFQDLAGCENYLNKSLLPLTRQVSGRPDLKPYAKPAAMIDSLSMALSVFPLDGMLPTLVSAADPRQMAKIFNNTLPEALTGEFIIRGVRLELAHYGRYQRCVLRYGVDGEQSSTGAPRHIVVYGKVDADRQGGLTVQVINTLRKKLREPNLPYYFRVPASYGYLPDIDLLLMEALPGEPVIQRLIKEGKEDGAPWQDGSFTAEAAMEVCARMLLTLHGSGIKLGPRVPLEYKAGSVKKEIRMMQEFFPELGDQFGNWMDEILTHAQGLSSMPLCLSHGDYTYTQLIFEGSQGGLVDFDTMCQAEPALDLGHFLAYLRLAIRKDHPALSETAERLCAVFLDAYIAGSHEWVGDEQSLRARVAVYELISLIRLMLHSLQKFKGIRLQLALSLFEERYACLKQVN